MGGASDSRSGGRGLVHRFAARCAIDVLLLQSCAVGQRLQPQSLWFSVHILSLGSAGANECQRSQPVGLAYEVSPDHAIMVCVARIGFPAANDQIKLTPTMQKLEVCLRDHA
jgi:hypothetical protein